MSLPTATIHADGACRPNPGKGSYVAIVQTQYSEWTVFNIDPDTTSNRMELMAVIAGIESLGQLKYDILIVTNSKYVIGNIEGCYNGAANRDLIDDMLELCRKHNVRTKWVKCHSGHDFNERAHSLANALVQQ